MTNGKTTNSVITLQDLFNQQMANQRLLLFKGVYNKYKNENTTTILPVDDIGLASYHIQQLVSEIGEVLEADKRWKSHRNDKYDVNAKLEEIADCFIVMMNIAMFSGFDGDQLVEAIEQKLNEVSKRIGA